MRKYSSNEWTWGYEIEWGDIDRRLTIPDHLGAWEHAETDIVNIHEPYKYVACDPLGQSPYMGGEVNTKPTKTWSEQTDRIMELHQFFVSHGNTPSSSCVNHGHLHVYVPGLKDDVEALKRLVAYIKDNQHLTIQRCYGFLEHSDMKNCAGAKMYLKYDGGRPMPDYMCNNIITLTDSFERFIDAALNGGPSVDEIFAADSFSFPPFIWNREEYVGWIQTKYDKSRGHKQRQYHDVA